MSQQRRRRALTRPPLGEEELFAYAVASLARQMRSERDLRRLMSRRAEPGPDGAAALDRVLARLRELRYLSDERFAFDFARSRRDNRSQGERRVRQDLTARGIGKGLVTQALAETFPAEDEAALARTFVERKRMQPPTDPRSTARFVGRLLRNGFRASTVWALLRSWNLPVEEESISSLAAPEEDDGAASDAGTPE